MKKFSTNVLLNGFYVYICVSKSKFMENLKIRAKIESPSKLNRLRRNTKHELSIQAVAKYYARVSERMAYGRFAIIDYGFIQFIKVTTYDFPLND